jgi:hypothetical protein
LKNALVNKFINCPYPLIQSVLATFLIHTTSSKIQHPDSKLIPPRLLNVGNETLFRTTLQGFFIFWRDGLESAKMEKSNFRTKPGIFLCFPIFSFQDSVFVNKKSLSSIIVKAITTMIPIDFVNCFRLLYAFVHIIYLKYFPDKFIGIISCI